MSPVDLLAVIVLAVIGFAVVMTVLGWFFD